jgi:hypothetical protein
MEDRFVRRLRIAVIYAAVAISLLVGEVAATALHSSAASLASAQQTPSLQDTLEKGLKARRPEEFEFLAKVVELVNTDKLPLDVVLSTFKWARPKKPAPMPYFQRAMQIRAAELGVEL